MKASNKLAKCDVTGLLQKGANQSSPHLICGLFSSLPKEPFEVTVSAAFGEAATTLGTYTVDPTKVEEGTLVLAQCNSSKELPCMRLPHYLSFPQSKKKKRNP